LAVAYWVLKVLLTPVFYCLWRVKIEGRENLPTHGPAVLAANHQSFCDSFFLPLVVRRRLTYVAKAEYFEQWRTSWFFRAAGQIPIQRSGGDASQRALTTAMGVLERGGLLGIYPEGTRAPDVRLHKGHTGAARLSLHCGVPIIPVGISGTRVVQPPGSRFMRPFHTVTVRFGPPMTRREDDRAGRPGGTESCPDEDAEQLELRGYTDALMSEIAKLSGQEYVDHYAKRKKNGSRPTSAGSGSEAGGARAG
jgi:1-acyl-sn-glycerol-3-phosphate acyltransferase